MNITRSVAGQVLPPHEVNPSDDPMRAMGMYQLRITLSNGLVCFHGPMKSEDHALLTAKEVARLESVSWCKVIYHMDCTMHRANSDGTVTKYKYGGRE